MWALLCIYIVLAMHGPGSGRPAAGASRPAAVAPNPPLTRDRFRELVSLANITETPTVTYLITLAAALAIPLTNATDAQRRRRQELIVATGMQFHQLLTDPHLAPTLGPPVSNATVEQQDDLPHLDTRRDPSSRELADAARQWGDIETVVNLLNFTSHDELSDTQRSALDELAKAEGFQSLADVLSRTRSLPKPCFAWMRSLIVRATDGTTLAPSCDKGDQCSYRSTHHTTLQAFSRQDYLAYASAICRGIFRPTPPVRPAVQPAPAAPGDDADGEELQPELRVNPRWLITLRTDRPGLQRVQDGWPINEHLQYHKDKALAATTERERMRQLEHLRSWCKQLFPRDAQGGFFDLDFEEPQPTPTPQPVRGLTAVQRTPPGQLPELRGGEGGPSISPALRQRQASPSARRGRRERDRSRDRRDRSRDRRDRRSREPVPRGSDAASDVVLAQLSTPGALTDEARIAALERQARLARAEAAALEAQRALERQRSGGTHANRSLDLRADRGRSAMSDTASDVSRSAATPPGIGTARRSEVLGGLSGPSRAHEGPRHPPALGGSAPAPAATGDSPGTSTGFQVRFPNLSVRPPASADSLGGPPPQPPVVNPAARDDDDGSEVRVVSDDPYAGVCTVCHERPRTMKILPCGHDAFCAECLADLPQRICPLCRADIQSVVPRAPPPAPPGPPAAGAPAPAAGAAPAVNI